ncbi:uncharacterized protein LOC142829885 isoform X2 [Pelodiscus sinensis]
MATALSKKAGHHPRTLDQVRAKVKELRQGYARARDASSRSGAAPASCPYYRELHQIMGGGDAQSPRHLMESGLEMPPVTQHEQQEDNDDQLVQEKEEEEDSVTITLNLVPQAQDSSSTSSDAREGTSASTAVTDGRATPSQPASCSGGSRRHWQTHQELMRQHISVLWDMHKTFIQKFQEEADWRERMLAELVRQGNNICATIREVMAPFTAPPASAPFATPPAPAPMTPPAAAPLMLTLVPFLPCPP